MGITCDEPRLAPAPTFRGKMIPHHRFRASTGELPASSNRKSCSPHFAQSLLVRANPCRFGDRYEIDAEPFARGEYGVVHRCMDKLVQVYRAVKRIPLPSDTHGRMMLENEVKALVALNHPHIVRLVEYFVEDGEVLLVMELLNGPSMLARIEEASGRSLGEEATALCV